MKLLRLGASLRDGLCWGYWIAVKAFKVVLTILEGKWPSKKGLPLFIFSVNRVIRVDFCPPTHLGKIMDLIRSDVKDLIRVAGPSILTEIRAMPAKAPAAVTMTWRGKWPAVCASACWAPQNTVFFWWAFPEGYQHRGSKGSLVMLPWSFSSFPCWSPCLWKAGPSISPSWGQQGHLPLYVLRGGSVSLGAWGEMGTFTLRSPELLILPQIVAEIYCLWFY